MELIKSLQNATPQNVLDNQKRYRERNRSLVRERTARSRAKRPAAERRAAERSAIEHDRVTALMFHGGQCARCKNNDMRVLQFDHVNGGGTEENRRIHSRGVARKALQRPNEYQVLCANCNWIKRFERNENKQRLDS